MNCHTWRCGRATWAYACGGRQHLSISTALLAQACSADRLQQMCESAAGGRQVTPQVQLTRDGPAWSPCMVAGNLPVERSQEPGNRPRLGHGQAEQTYRVTARLPGQCCHSGCHIDILHAARPAHTPCGAHQAHVNVKSTTGKEPPPDASSAHLGAAVHQSTSRQNLQRRARCMSLVPGITANLTWSLLPPPAATALSMRRRQKSWQIARQHNLRAPPLCSSTSRYTSAQYNTRAPLAAGQAPLT